MSMDRQDLAGPRAGRKRVRATLSLTARKARTPSGASRAGAATVVSAAVTAQSACGSSPGTSPSDAAPGVAAPAGGAIISRVKSAPGAISYVGVSYQSPVTNAGEGEAALGNSSGNFVLPTSRAIQAALASITSTPANETISLINGPAGQAYPIINYEYALVNTSQPSATRAQDLRAFLSWAITSGTAQLARVNFQPLPSSIVTLSAAQIAKTKD
jgi:phosphate transport system substrate-binding protein